jgi:hypothetical protein
VGADIGRRPARARLLAPKGYHADLGIGGDPLRMPLEQARDHQEDRLGRKIVDRARNGAAVLPRPGEGEIVEDADGNVDQREPSQSRRQPTHRPGKHQGKPAQQQLAGEERQPEEQDGRGGEIAVFEMAQVVELQGGIVVRPEDQDPFRRPGSHGGRPEDADDVLRRHLWVQPIDEIAAVDELEDHRQEDAHRQAQREGREEERMPRNQAEEKENPRGDLQQGSKREPFEEPIRGADEALPVHLASRLLEFRLHRRGAGALPGAARRPGSDFEADHLDEIARVFQIGLFDPRRHFSPMPQPRR